MSLYRGKARVSPENGGETLHVSRWSLAPLPSLASVVAGQAAGGSLEGRAATGRSVHRTSKPGSRPLAGSYRWSTPSNVCNVGEPVFNVVSLDTADHDADGSRTGRQCWLT